jgi:hypothetical protein
MPQVPIPTTTQDTARTSRFAATGGTQTNVVKDGLDTTYLRRSSVGSPGAYFHLGIPTIPANNDVATVVPCARIKQPTGTAPKVLALLLYGYTVTPAKKATKTAKAVPATTSYPAGPRVAFPGVFSAAANVAADASNGAVLSPNGTGWLAALQAGKVGIAVDDGHAPTDANRDYIYELTAAAYYAARPTATVAVDASTPLNASSFPLFDVTVSALIEAWQDNVGSATGTDCMFDLHIFTAAQQAAGGFDPAVTVPLWASSGPAPLSYVDGVTPSASVPSVACDTALANGSYYAYVRAIRSFTGAVYGAWSSLAFTVAVAPPTSPTISAVTDDANQRVAVTVTPNASSGASGPSVSLQRTADGGVTWQAVRGATSVPCTFGTPVVFTDCTAPRAGAVTYRALVVATVSAQLLCSAWTTAAVTGPASVGWNLKVPDAPAMGMLGASVRQDPDFQQVEETVEFNVPGRTYPVVVSMALNGIDGGFDIETRTDTDWTLLQAIMAYRAPLFLESPFGWGRWIRIIPTGGGRSAARKWTEVGTPGDARRRVHLDYREVGEP